MQTLVQQFHPMTAAPFRDHVSYCEVMPCDALKPYVRCFWGTKEPIRTTVTLDHSVVIPDTCMDVIFHMDYRSNQCSSVFCGMDEHSSYAAGTCSTIGTSIFGIRFYAWTAILFSKRDLKGSRNRCFPAEAFFGNLIKEMELFLPKISALQERIQKAEEILLRHLCAFRIQNDFLNAVHYTLKSRGSGRLSDVCTYTAVSERTLERLFAANMGIPPKSFSSLVRYQFLWQDMLYHPDFHILDAVETYEYFDQSHLLHDFRKRHRMTPGEAITFALQNR